MRFVDVKKRRAAHHRSVTRLAGLKPRLTRDQPDQPDQPVEPVQPDQPRVTRATFVSRHRDDPRRPDDRLRLRGLHVARSARQPDAARRCYLALPDGTLDPGRHVARSAAQALRYRSAPRRRDALHPQPRRSRARPGRRAAIQPDAATAIPCYADAQTMRESAPDVRLHLRSRDAGRRRTAADRAVQVAGPFAWAASRSRRCRCCTAAAGLRLPDRIVRVPDRLQRDSRRSWPLLEASTCWCSTRCAIARTPRTSASPKRSRSSQRLGPRAGVVHAHLPRPAARRDLRRAARRRGTGI